MLSRVLRTTMAMGAAMCISSFAMAQPNDGDFQSAGGSYAGYWDQTASWLVYDSNVDPPWTPANSVPTSTDVVTIVSGDTITVRNASAVADTLTVSGTLAIAASVSTPAALTVRVATSASGGLVDITGGSGLTPGAGSFIFSNANGTPSLTVNQNDGVKLENANSKIVAQASMTISGTGSLKGLANFATIELSVASASNVQLVSQVLMYGQFEILRSGVGAGLGVFDNSGQIQANVNGGEILLDGSLDSIIDSAYDCAHPRWLVDVGGASLRFGRAATGLVGDFRVGTGVASGTYATLYIDASVTTSNDLKLMHRGVIDVTGVSFTFGANCSSPDCSPTPGSIGDTTCN